MRVTYDYYRVPANIGATGIFTVRKRGKPHLSQRYIKSKPNFEPSPKGGGVVCRIWTDDQHLLAEGIAECSMSDNFNYRVGREIALGRAEVQIETKAKW